MTRCSAVLLGVAGVALAAACGGDGALKSPKSDSQYDDGEDPGTGPPTGGSAPDAGGDAAGRACRDNGECPASHQCSFAISAGCAATGVCMLYAAPAGCEMELACGCVVGQKVTLCAPPGYANAPVARCSDAGVDSSVADSSTD